MVRWACHRHCAAATVRPALIDAVGKLSFVLFYLFIGSCLGFCVNVLGVALFCMALFFIFCQF